MDINLLIYITYIFIRIKNEKRNKTAGNYYSGSCLICIGILK